MTALKLTREQILVFRRQTNGVDARLPAGRESLRQAAFCGLQDSMPRAAVLSIHARVAGTPVNVLDDPVLAQVWGPRYSVYVVARDDVPIFTLSRLPDDEKGRRRAEEMADRLADFLVGRRMKDRDVHTALGVGNSIKYATTTGRVLIRWEGAFAPMIWMQPTPSMSVADARRELARRYLHVFGPTTATAFAEWAGLSTKAGVGTFEVLRGELIDVETPLGAGVILRTDEEGMRAQPGPPAVARLLPSGDTYYLLWRRDREVLVPDAARRAQLWTTRVWPGALLVRGEVAGVWRRSNEKFTFETWRPLSTDERQAVEAEASSMPLPGFTGAASVDWS